MRRFLASISVLSLLLIAVPAHAMVRPMFGIIHGATNNTTSRFTGVDGNVVISTSASGEHQLISTGGTIGDLTVSLESAPGAGTSYAITLQKGTGGGAEADTALTCTISNTNTTCSDHSDQVTVAAGNTVAFKIVPTGTPAQPLISISSSFTGTTAGETIQPGGGASANLNAANTNYFPLSGRNVITNIEASTTIYAPTAGSLDNLYLQLNGVPSVGSYTIALMKNDATTTVTCTVTSAVTTCNDTTHSVAFVQGDKLAISINPASSPTARVAAWGTRLKPTVDGESIISGIGSVLSLTRWINIAGTMGNGATPNSTTTAPIAFVAKKGYYQGDVTLTGTQTRNFTFEDNAVTTAFSVLINSTSGSSGTDNTNTASIAQGDQIEWKTTTANTPPTNVNYFSLAFAAFVDPGAAAHCLLSIGSQGFLKIFTGGSFSCF